MERRQVDWLGTATIAAVTLATAAAGARSGDFHSAWYRRLRKPAWQPSGAVIGAIWTVLYTLTATAAGLLWWRRRAVDSRGIWALLALQYALNVAYTPVFTRLRALRLATLDAGLLSLTVSALILLVWPVRRIAALLLVPYSLWAGFATLLSLRLWHLNR